MKIPVYTNIIISNLNFWTKSIAVLRVLFLPILFRTGLDLKFESVRVCTQRLMGWGVERGWRLRVGGIRLTEHSYQSPTGSKSPHSPYVAGTDRGSR